MIADNNRKATILAYYFSKFDRDAMAKLGYSTLTEAFEELSKKFGKDNQYLKLRRDEFDPLTGSHRVGFNKRNPNHIVEVFHNGLKNYSFDELTGIVKALLVDNEDFALTKQECIEVQPIITKFSEEEFERIINMQDNTATIKQRFANINTRVFDAKVQKSLKQLYKFKCQICGATATVCYDVDVSEAHHLDYFTKSMNNNASNVMILCPDHHRIIHKAHAKFNRELMQFEYENGKVDELMYNIHL